MKGKLKLVSSNKPKVIRSANLGDALNERKLYLDSLSPEERKSITTTLRAESERIMEIIKRVDPKGFAMFNIVNRSNRGESE